MELLYEIDEYATSKHCDCDCLDCNSMDRCPICYFCTAESHISKGISNQHQEVCILYGLKYVTSDELSEVKIKHILKHIKNRVKQYNVEIDDAEILNIILGVFKCGSYPVASLLVDIGADKYYCGGMTEGCNSYDLCPVCNYCTNIKEFTISHLHDSNCFFYGLHTQIPIEGYGVDISESNFFKVAEFIAKKFNYAENKKIEAIKKLREYTKCGLKEAKDEIEKFIKAEEVNKMAVDNPKPTIQMKTLGLGQLLSEGKTKYKLYLWKLSDNDFEHAIPSSYDAWNIVTHDVVMTEGEIKSVFENEMYSNGEYILFARKTGKYKNWWIGAIYKYPSSLGKIFVNELFKKFLEGKKGVPEYSQLKTKVKFKSSYEDTYGGYKSSYKQYNEPVVEEPEIISPDRTWIKDQLSCKTFPAKSQKIKGLRYASGVLQRVADVERIGNAVVITEEKDFSIDHKHHKYGHYGSVKSARVTINEVIKEMYNNFVRPCPQNPEHGFVDSRLIKNNEEAQEIIDEIYKTGEIPEMIIMPKITCDYSSVICPDRIAFGKSNDGATQGSNAVGIALSISPEDVDNARKNFWSSPSWPFAEVLYENSSKHPILVQLRSGPSMDVMKAKKVKIVEIHNVDSSMDLIEWGKEAKKIRERVKELNNDNNEEVENTVAIWHPGGEFLSHFGVHCRTAEPVLPYITTEKAPKIGEVIEIGVKGKKSLQSIREGLIEGLTIALDGGDKDTKEWNNAVNDLKSFIGMLHISSIADLSDNVTAKYLGYTFAIGARIIAALPYGECTHHSHALNDMKELLGKENTPIHERDYQKVWNLDIEIVLAGLNICYNSFEEYSWPGGYGGSAWANCADLLLKVFSKIKSFINSPAEERYNEMIDSINIMVNAAHNNGWWLNKMTDKQVFDDASILPHFMLRPKRAFEARDIKIGAFQAKLKAVQMIKKLSLDMESIEMKKEELKKAAKEAAIIEAKKAEEAMKAYEIEQAKKAEELAKEEKEKSELLAKKLKDLMDQEKVGFCIEGQYYIQNNHVHLQVASKVHVGKDYGMSGDVILDDAYSYPMIKEYKNKKKGEFLESLTSKGVYKYVNVKIIKSLVKDSGWFILENNEIIPWIAQAFYMKLSMIEKGESSDESF